MQVRHAILLMGVSGSGKTVVAQAVATVLGPHVQLLDADDFHSRANIERMRSGIPLTDADRAPWLKAQAQALSAWWAHTSGAPFFILGSSLLKRAYRDSLRVVPSSHLTLVYLHGSEELLTSRLRGRDAAGEHFMHIGMLRSQLDTLEIPQSDESDVLTIHLSTDTGVPKTVQMVTEEVLARVMRRAGGA